MPLTGYFTTTELEGKQFSSFSTEKSSIFPEKRRFNPIVSLLKINESNYGITNGWHDQNS